MRLIAFTRTEVDTVAVQRRHSLGKFLAWKTFASLFVTSAILFGIAMLALLTDHKGLSFVVLAGALLGGVAFRLR